jgi:hypothetical protein
VLLVGYAVASLLAAALSLVMLASGANLRAIFGFLLGRTVIQTGKGLWLSSKIESWLGGGYRLVVFFVFERLVGYSQKPLNFICGKHPLI